MLDLRWPNPVRISLALYSSILLALTFLFFVRVLAQALALLEFSSLPSMEEWVIPSASPFSTSGLVPYRILLPIQIVILTLQVCVCRDFIRGRGYFLSLTGSTGRILIRLSYLYFASMILRYIVTMAVYPERRWLGHTVPILLHFTLAGFLFTLGRYSAVREVIRKT
ncbi:MAG TPA: hypothetical protein VNL14_17100 [Candidatus Acidoferrales bacterium]|nr:hypothetical protein [Candidatus Acidoferrales bacterium]